MSPGVVPAFFFSIAELNLQQQYHDLNKKNSVFDQMYKLYTKRLVNKDAFKEQTGIKVKAMPKPHIKRAFCLAQLSVLMYNMPIPYTTETIHPFPKEQTA